MVEQEEFRTINGFPNYKINCYGKVINTKKNEEISQHLISNKYYYVNVSNGKNTIKYVHRLVYEHFGNNPEDMDDSQVEHEDQQPKNNYIQNLRLASRRQNSYNVEKKSNTSSTFKGVCYHKQRGKWLSYINVFGKSKSLGLYKYQYNAGLAYDIVARHLHEEYYYNQTFNEFDGEIPDSDEGAKAKAERFINNL